MAPVVLNAAPVVKVSASAAPKPASKAAAAVPKKCVSVCEPGLLGGMHAAPAQSPRQAGSSTTPASRTLPRWLCYTRPGGVPAVIADAGLLQSVPGSRDARLTRLSCRAGRTPSWLPLRWPPPRWLPGYAGYRRLSNPPYSRPVGPPAAGWAPRCLVHRDCLRPTRGGRGARPAGVRCWLDAPGLSVAGLLSLPRPDACCPPGVCPPSPPRR